MGPDVIPMTELKMGLQARRGHGSEMHRAVGLGGVGSQWVWDWVTRPGDGSIGSLEPGS